MKTSDLSFDLPEELIAQEPPKVRGTARLLVVDRGTGVLSHHRMSDLPSMVPDNAVIVFNNTRVRKSRLLGIYEKTGGRQELLLLRRRSTRVWEVLGKPAKRLREGARFLFEAPEAYFFQERPPGNSSLSPPLSETGASIPSESLHLLRAEVIETAKWGPDSSALVEFDRPVDDDLLDRCGHVPLPPYIHRSDRREDTSRYQTVFSSVRGSVAAPTAGLHFTPEILSRLTERGIQQAFVTLHVGIGTFLPVRTDRLEDHRMHQESYYISPATSELLSSAFVAGRPIVAVGTTVVRTLESAWEQSTNKIPTGHRTTDLFITPGYRFNVVSHMFTNFHTPHSTLLAMVSAFAGRDEIMNAYREAVDKQYRFFSYGDAMLIL